MDALVSSMYSVIGGMNIGYFLVILVIIMAIKFVFKLTKTAITVFVIAVAFNIFCTTNVTAPLLNSQIIKQDGLMSFSLYDKDNNRTIDRDEIKSVKFENGANDVKLVISYKDSSKKNTKISIDKDLKEKVEGVLNSLSISTE